MVKQRDNEDENERYDEKEALGPGLIAGREEGGKEPVDGHGGKAGGDGHDGVDAETREDTAEERVEGEEGVGRKDGGEKDGREEEEVEELHQVGEKDHEDVEGGLVDPGTAEEEALEDGEGGDGYEEKEKGDNSEDRFLLFGRRLIMTHCPENRYDTIKTILRTP